MAISLAEEKDWAQRKRLYALIETDPARLQAAPDDSPLLMRDRSTQEIYSPDVRFP